MPDGTVTTDSSHELRVDAALRAKEIDVEAARDTYIDPRGGRIPLADWVPIWETTHQAGPATWAAYRSHLRLHILPALGPLPLVDIRRQHVKTLAVALGKRLSPRSVADVIMVLSMVLQEAVEDRRVPFNPCRGVRIPKGIRAERPHATAEQVAAIVARQARPSDGLRLVRGPVVSHPERSVSTTSASSAWPMSAVASGRKWRRTGSPPSAAGLRACASRVRTVLALVTSAGVRPSSVAEFKISWMPSAGWRPATMPVSRRSAEASAA
ncbi:hypothetical protein [Micromonospora sp. M61]|uniref:hypothetical protein n=1 Tax=Micromonospora sp. M61 TaxID=2824890 RepID=UPI0035B39D96